MSSHNILGVKISTLSKKEILKKISGFLTPHPSRHPTGQANLSHEGRGAFIVTPNPEFLLAARKDEEFFYILNKADLAIPDGVGLVFAGLFMGKFIRRVSGIDLMYDICELAERENKSVYLLGGRDGVAQEAGEKLQKFYPNLKIVGAEVGLQSGAWELQAGKWLEGASENQKLLERINKTRPDIIFVAFGHPKQEKWIYHALHEGEQALAHLQSVRLAMGVGGSFDFIAGRIKRAPRMMRAVGLEWLWRLVQEPRKRWKRIYDAVIRFPLLFLRWRLKK